MPIRTFLVASSVARLIQRELGSEWRVEGYLNGGDNRRTHVVLEGNDGHLVLEEEIEGNLTVEDTVVPRRQAEALLDACVGRLDIDRITMTVHGRPAILDRISTAGKRVDLLTVTLDETQRAFHPPGWIGREITDKALDLRTLATAGIPAQNETSISNSGLASLLDMLERGAEDVFPARQTKGEKASLFQNTTRQGASRPANEPAPESHTPVMATTPDRPLRELLSGVLSKTGSASPPEGSAPSEPDNWGQRRKD